MNNLFSKRHKFVLEQKNKYQTMTVEFSKKLLDVDKKEYEIELVKSIKNFLVTMINKCSNFNPNLFMHNIKKTSFTIKKLEEYKNGKVGGTVTISNINTLKINSFDIMEHELMHLATIKKDIYNYPGFNSYLEGYTELLTKRYFEYYKSQEYPLLVIFAQNIESILGKDLMENKFFEGKFFNTINELYKYCSEEKVKRMFFKLSCINSEFSNYNNFFDTQYVQSCWNEIYEILIECLKNKCKEVNNKEEISSIINNGKWIGQINFRFVAKTENNKIYNLNAEKFNEVIVEIYDSIKLKNKRN